MITKKNFGKAPNGEEITLYSIANANGLQADVMNFGAILVNLYVPNKKGKKADVVLGYDDIKKYYKNGCYFGSTIGPLSNRTAKAKVKIDGKTYKLPVNDNANNLHSDADAGLHKRVFKAKADEKKNAVTFSVSLKDGELGLPGNRDFTVTYALTEDNGLEITYTGKSDKESLFNPTNHSYFNLRGHDAATIEESTLQLNCSGYTEVEDDLIPTGKIVPVIGTPMDFTKPEVIGKRIRARYPQLRLAGGYDHNFVIDGANGKLKLAGVLSDKKAGRTMEVYTDMPGIQVYTANFVGRHLGKEHVMYHRRNAVCLETQFFPNSANDKNFETPVLLPGKKVTYKTVYRFI
ncbi:MAG: galactose mutarotase [Lachnospiraceae bacterium]|nr:galactose mutarotase [Lachnospiraceae bacterium]